MFRFRWQVSQGDNQGEESLRRQVDRMRDPGHQLGGALRDSPLNQTDGGYEYDYV
jgi:hypothetical protein